MTEETKITGIQKFRSNLQEFYWLVLWVAWILIGLAFLELDPAWVGWILIVLGAIGLIVKVISFFNKSPIFTLIESVANLGLAIILAISFFMSLKYGGDFTWAWGAGAVCTAALGISGLVKYKKSKAKQ